MATLGQLRIGDISTPIIKARAPERVPTNTDRIDLNNQASIYSTYKTYI
jgi:hypothetical protein